MNGEGATSDAVLAPALNARLRSVDALRGIALLAMIAYHFAFDLRHFGVIRADFEHSPVWLAVRGAILASFLLLAGVSLVLAHRANAGPARFWRRIGEIAACALLVSAGSYLMFPQSYIWFGVLHAIAVTLILARPLVRHPLLCTLIGIGVITAGIVIAHPAFDNRKLGWIGFMTGKPYTEDYVPLFPWAGVVFLGITAGRMLVHQRFQPIALFERAPAWLAMLGRHTLLIYMVHQPLLIGLLWLALRR